MSTIIILQQMGVICLLVCIGFYLQKRGTVDSVTSRKLSAIVMDICNPALIMASILSGHMTAGHRDLLIAIGLGIGFYTILILIGLLFPRILKVEKDKRRFYNLMCVYTNTGFLGIPVARAILPDNAILYVIVCNVMYSLLFYTHGITVLGGGKEKGNLRKIFSPGTIMAVLSLVVFWFNITPPPILANTIEYVGNATVFLSMMLLGVSIARSPFITALKDFRIWAYIVLRMILVPIVLTLSLKAAGFDKTATLALCLMAAVPVGNLPMIQAEKIGEDTTILSTAVAVTTTVSIITITLLMSFFSAGI